MTECLKSGFCWEMTSERNAKVSSEKTTLLPIATKHQGRPCAGTSVQSGKLTKLFLFPIAGNFDFKELTGVDFL